MKIKFLFFSFFLSVSGWCMAQNTITTSHKLIWKGIEKWYADSSSVQVISFRDAHYPYENRLPYFNYRIPAENYSYKAVLTNTVFEAVNTEEEAILSDKAVYSSEPVLETRYLVDRGSSFFDVQMLPFVFQNGKFLKLISFDLSISKTALPQQAKNAFTHSFASSSVLAQGKFVKVRLADSGIYKLTYEDLVAMGINPSNVRVFGYGGGVLDQNFTQTKPDDLPEVPIWVEKGSDGIFNAGDYILFYAQGVVRWSYDKNKSMFVHKNNSYSQYGYYFITSDAGVGRKIESNSIELPADVTIYQVDEFTDYQLYEKDIISLTKSGKEFYGETFSNTLSYSFVFNLPNVVKSNTLKLSVDVAASSLENSSFSLNLNGSQNKTLSVTKNSGDNYEIAKSASSVYTFTPDNETLTFNITYNKSTSTSTGYLNYLEVNARRKLVMQGAAMRFQNVDYLGKSSYNNYTLSNVNGNVQIWDITDPQNIYRVATTTLPDNKLSFVASGNELHQYIAIDPTAGSSFPKPEIVGVVANQNLHALQPSDLVIITHPNFLSQAETLAQAHREKDGLSVVVATTEQVYNEFSSGTPDATSYRWFVKMLYDRAIETNNTADLPKYLLLFGRGSYDNRGIIPNSGDNLILTYQAENSLVLTSSYVTDDYFGFMDDSEGTQVTADLMDVAVGRFPVSTVQQATDVVNKTINYIENKEKGIWKNQICFLADDGDNALHMRQSDSIAVTVAKNVPAFQINKIYLDAFVQEVNASGQSYPLARSRFHNLLRSGMFLLDYTGHAGYAGWTNENILTTADVKSLSNKNLPVWMAATCDFLQFDVKPVSAGEYVILNSVGGGIGLFSAARPVYASQNFYINKYFVENLFKKNGDYPRVGDAVRLAKNSIGTENNKLSYIYLGDPAVRLNYPDQYKVITSKINDSEVLGKDTLKALSTATVSGFIADQNGNKVSDFNGTVEIVVYDKVEKITTLNNEGDGTLTYYDRSNTLFSGKVKVVNGELTFTFLLPKDIKYNYGSGRINYYAYDETNNVEAQGYFENFLIGGSSTNLPNDNIGPEIDIYLNSPEFVSGGKVNETPLFVANISDENGINTVGSGIGHDLLLTVDNDPNKTYILNDYYTAAENSYQQGTVSYKLSTLQEGKHTLTFRAFDLLNNSTSDTIEFEVVKGLAPVIFSVYNYPNPVREQTKFVIQHDRPETLLTTTVEIFDLSGRKIWMFSQTSADEVTWNLTTSNGEKVQKGIYLYRVSIRTENSSLTSKTNKIIVF
ncbi:MAG TPA: type IX secretion system sortase PorU, partial [Paludibacteraceae bacterium]|nr:type IX secretion system sortase PorU [Paludibacteraceae bacterium]